MDYNYQLKITFQENEQFNVSEVNNLYNMHPNENILVEVANTKGITSSMLRQLNSRAVIRIAGAYDKERVEKNKNVVFKSGETGKYFQTAVIYTRNEAIKMVEEMEKIESGLDKNWLPIQKMLYIYNYLKENIIYDSKFEEKTSREIRSLRGLISKYTVCAGYAVIFKELMDRNGIYCEYVSGCVRKDVNGRRTGGHAWNIIQIDGKKYPVDLTWDSSKYRAGYLGNFEWLTKPVEEFSKNHIPDDDEKTQNYSQNLSQFDAKLIRKLYLEMGLNRVKVFEGNNYMCTRSDKSRFKLTQVGDAFINGTRYFRYYYADVDDKDNEVSPKIFFSETNFDGIIDDLTYGNNVLDNYIDSIVNVLFAKENISNSLSKNSYYLGRIEKFNPDESYSLSSSPKEIVKPKEKLEFLNYPIKTFKRSDGSTFLLQKASKAARSVNGITYYVYDVFERIKVNGKSPLKRNVIYSEQDLFCDNRVDVPNYLLNRERLNRKEKEAGGYIGYLGSDGSCHYNPLLVAYFQTSRAVSIDILKQESTHGKPFVIPTFKELRMLASTYRTIYIEKNNLSVISVYDIKNGQFVTDNELKRKAIFANMWLSAAGVKWVEGESIGGITYAFNDAAKVVYAEICNELFNDCRDNGMIDTVKLLDKMGSSKYKHTQNIIVRLFNNDIQTKFINSLFLRTLNLESKKEDPVTLYTMEYAGILLNQRKNGYGLR